MLRGLFTLSHGAGLRAVRPAAGAVRSDREDQARTHGRRRAPLRGAAAPGAAQGQRLRCPGRRGERACVSCSVVVQVCLARIGEEHTPM